ncbi:hypothetical protein [Shewanella maritima]|uniref:hypothetical protein n=1 Tax=Shewanella maritima TaxID=2520507 RepID=UPI003734D8CE
MKKLSSITRFVCLSFIGFSLVGCIQQPQWTLFYAADQAELPENLVQHDFITGYYGALEQCQAKGNGMLKLAASNVAPKDAFVCGELCENNEQTGAIQCQTIAPGKANAF